VYNSLYRFGLTLFMFLLVFAIIEVILVPFLSMLWLLSISTLVMASLMLGFISRQIRKEYKKSLQNDH